ncbi:4Fe-4S dicluster domain-containing protein [Mycoplasmatota bacterium zrk1]
MAHNTTKNGYKKLEERLNKFPQGVPPSETLYKILSVMFSEEEAKLVSLLPIKPFTVETAMKNWKKTKEETEKILNELASRALLLDIDNKGVQTYILPPPMAGFLEFSLMRVGGNLDQKVLSELFHQYINVEDEFITDLMTIPTPVGRAFINESVLKDDKNLYILDYERASEVIKTASHIGVGTCYCRHKKEHIGTDCDAPKEICMTFNGAAESLIKHGYAKELTVEECLDLLDVAYDNNLVQFGENVQKEVAFICNCCGCCCEALIGARLVGVAQAIHTTNFLPKAHDTCNGCGKCVEVCPVEALSLVSSNNPHKIKQKKVKLIEENCLGCGVCARVCPNESIEMIQREKRVITPVNSAHRVVLEAIERGKLQNLIFDNQAHLNHRVMASILGVILKLPPIKQILASEQMKSKFLANLARRYNRK